jgi:hypothetical protein
MVGKCVVHSVLIPCYVTKESLSIHLSLSPSVYISVYMFVFISLSLFLSVSPPLSV